MVIPTININSQIDTKKKSSSSKLQKVKNNLKLAVNKHDQENTTDGQFSIK
jgi:hypothetical protein